MVNKELIEKYFNDVDELKAIELLLSWAKWIKRIYNARSKASDRAFNTTSQRKWTRGGLRTTIDAKHTEYCEQYESQKQDFYEYVEAFKNKYK